MKIVPLGALSVQNHYVCVWGRKRSVHHVLLVWTLNLSKHRLGKNGAGINYHHSSAKGPSQYWQSGSWDSASAGRTTINGSVCLGMTPQGSFDNIHSGEHNGFF